MNPSPRPAHLCTHSSLGVLLPVRTRRGPSSPRCSALVGLGEAPSHVRMGGFSEVRPLSPEVCGRRAAPLQLHAERPETLSVWSALEPSVRPPGDNLEQPFPSWGAGPHREAASDTSGMSGGKMTLDQVFGLRTSVPAPPPTTGHVPSWRLRALVRDMPELGRKSPGNPQRTMDPTTGTNCQIQIPSYLTLSY
ncbi:uncharacterized protein [Bos indicus]|uniref:Uncharacterized protein isoform X2 n=1 Tax=Bos indicus TaxID=9915 RepID=A0ABM4RQE9_BOSIN